MSTEYPHRDPWSIRIGAAPIDPEVVVLVPPHVSLAHGFAKAEYLLRDHRVVRIVGRGVTSAVERPTALDDETKTLWLSELESYRLGDRAPAIAGFLPSIERWLRETLDVVPGHDAAQVFWTASMYILLEPLEEFVLARGIATLHRRDRIECLDHNWRCFRFIQAQASASAVTSRATGWRLRFIATWCALLPLSLGKRVFEFIRQAPSRRRIRSLRRSANGEVPTVWAGIIGDTPAVSRPVLELIRNVALADDEKIGVLLQGRLDPGLRRSMIWSDVERGPVLPCLDHDTLRSHVATVEQGISAEGAGELLKILLRTITASITAAIRITRLPPMVEDDRSRMPIEAPVAAIAKLATLHVLRALEARHASARMCDRARASGAVALLAQAHWPADVVMTKELERSGVLTAEIEHGGLAETALQFSGSRVATQVRVLWTVEEAKALQPYEPNQRVIGGYLPRPLPRNWTRPQRRPTDELRVLVASNYLPAPWGGDLHKWDAFQAPLLQHGAALLALGRRIRLRWRPHPSDDAVRIARFRAQFPQYEASTTSLDEDFKWCDILVTSLSSIIVEALWYGVPIFIHDIPIQTETTRRIFDVERRFGAPITLRERIEPLIAALDRGDDVLACERALRARLFGPRGEPMPARDLLHLRNELAVRSVSAK